jgi:predicted N-acetyltransferase YhbS
MNSALPQFSVDYLAECPQHIETLARWHFGEWGKWNPANDVAARSLKLQNYLRKDGVPLMFVAQAGGQPIGSAALVEQDLPERTDLSPWLASVFVDPAWRKQGVGRALVRRVMEEAARQGLAKFYLFTPDQQQFYESLGWTLLEQRTYHGDPIVVMEYVV